MHKLYLLNCEQCKHLHEQTGLCLLGFTVPESLYEAELVAEKEGILTICREVEKGELLANLVIKKTCEILKRRDLNVQFL
jgi:hypothetical protein